MAQLFQDEKAIPDNRARMNFVFLGYPYTPPIAAEDYREVMKGIQRELPIRLWYFLDEVTSAELMRKIWRAILRADFALYDVSGGNPNVAFELGLGVGEGKSCMTLLKTGSPNPLGGADLGYAERAEYTSVATLRETVTRLLRNRSSAMRKIRDVSYGVYDSAYGQSREEIETGITAVLNLVFQTKKITKSSAEKLLKDRKLADAVLFKLRQEGVLQVEGQRRGAKWVFTGDWVHLDHEVTGV